MMPHFRNVLFIKQLAAYCVQDSLEDEVYSSSESNTTQQSLSDENLMCYEEGRVPFFKVKAHRLGKTSTNGRFREEKCERKDLILFIWLGLT